MLKQTIAALALSTVLIATCTCNSGKTTNSDNSNAAITETVAPANTDGTLTETKTDTGNTNINNDANSSPESASFYTDNGKNKTGSKKGSGRNGKLTDGFFPEGSERLLDGNDTQFLTDWGHKIILNEIYARHGMKFTDPALKNHFSKQSWYRPANKDVYKQLSTIEKQNVAFLLNDKEKI